MEETPEAWNDWSISEEHLTASRLRKFHKNHPDETEAMLANLDQQRKVLNNNKTKSLLKYETAHCHREGGGLYAMDQSGGKGARESRLYF